LPASTIAAEPAGLPEGNEMKSVRSPLLVTAETRAVRVRKETKRHLAQAEDRYRGLLEAAPDAMVVVNQDGEIVLLNVQAEKQFGYRRDELLGQKVKNIIPEGFAERLVADSTRTAAEALAQQIGTGIELTALRKDGSEFPIELMLSPLESAEGILVTAAIRDISVRKAAEKHLAHMEDKLRHAQKMEAVGQLTGGIAHDFNNLLSVILGNVELARETAGLDQEVSSLLRDAQQAAVRGGELTRRLLAFSRQQALLPQRVDINALVAEVVKLLRRTLGATIAIETKRGPAPLFAIVDPGQLENALINLGVNARDAMPEGGGTLSITTRQIVVDDDHARNDQEIAPGHYVTIVISDNGTGMTEDVKSRAVEPFFTTKEVGKGSGLGLSMVYGFVKQSGGHVTIYSEVGHGTTIGLYLPVPSDDRAFLVRKQVRGAVVIGKSLNVLVVEDNDTVRATVVAMLKRMRFSVVDTPDGHAALAELGQGRQFDLMITDLVMPKGMSGIDLANRVRERWPHLPVIFVSGYSEDSEALAEVVRAGGAFLGKPFSRVELSDAIRAAMSVQQ
jgi:PAS domain S-box-containing protein